MSEATKAGRNQGWGATACLTLGLTFLATWGALALVHQDVHQQVGSRPDAAVDIPASALSSNATVLVQGVRVRYYHWHANCPALKRQSQQLSLAPVPMTQQQVTSQRIYPCGVCNSLDAEPGLATVRQPRIPPLHAVLRHRHS